MKNLLVTILALASGALAKPGSWFRLHDCHSMGLHECPNHFIASQRLHDCQNLGLHDCHNHIIASQQQPLIQNPWLRVHHPMVFYPTEPQGLWHQRATVRKHSYFLFALYDADRNSKLTAEEIYNYEKANNPYGPNFLFSLEEIKALIAQQDGSDGTPKDGQLNFGPEFDNYLLASIYKNLKGQYLYY